MKFKIETKTVAVVRYYEKMFVVTEQTATCTDDGAGTYDCGSFVLSTNP